MVSILQWLQELLVCLFDCPIIMNALYMHCHLQHQNTCCHEHCPKLDQDPLEQNNQIVLVLHLHHREWLGYKVVIHYVIGVSNGEQGHIVMFAKCYG